MGTIIIHAPSSSEAETASASILSTSTITTLKYTNPLDFNIFLEMATIVPDYPVTTTKESVGTGDGVTSVFYLDKKGLIQDSEILYTGSTDESGATFVMARGTHYNMDWDKSKITLTSPGVSVVGATTIFGEYYYNSFSKINTAILRALERAESDIDNMVGTVFASGLDATPTYTKVLNEMHIGGGQFLRTYQSDFYPINSTTTLASGAISAGASTVSVTSTNGFPSSGYFAIENDKVTYTGKTSTSFTGCSSIASSHTSGKIITSYVIERALDDEGNVPSWLVLQPDIDYNIDTESGEIKLVNSNVSNSVILDNFHPPRRTWDRVRISYQYGYDTIPKEIVRACYLIAARELYGANVLNALSRGNNGFQSDGIKEINEEIKRLVADYKCMKIKNINI